MNNTEIAKTIGISRQMLESTVCGKRNFSYQTTKRAVQIIGGTADTWQDPDYTALRMELFKTFKSRFTQKGDTHA